MAFCCGLVHLMSRMLDVLLGELPHAGLVADLEEAAEDGLQVLALDLHGGEGDVPVEALVEEEADAAPVLGDEGHAHLEGRARAR